MRRKELGEWRAWTAADFAVRADPAALPEWMDEPCSSETLRACLRDIEWANRFTVSHRPTLNFLERVAKREAGRELHIVDVGSGYGEMLRKVYHWARRTGVRVRLTGIDLQPKTAAIAAEATREAGLPEDAISWRMGDAMLAETMGPTDVVLSSLVMHHLPDPEIVRFVRWMERDARAGWYMNDLERQPVPSWLFGALARLVPLHEFVQHDGPVSFRRAFRIGDWERLLREAGVEDGAARIARVFPARLCVERMR